MIEVSLHQNFCLIYNKIYFIFNFNFENHTITGTITITGAFTLIYTETK